MKIGLNMMLWATHVEEKHFPLFDTLKAIGYDGVEIPILKGKPAHYEKIGQALKNSGLQCSSSTAMPGEDHNAISSDSLKRANAVSFMKNIIDCSNAVGADVLIGPFYQPLGVFTGSGPTETEKQFAIESHRAMADYAQTQNIKLAVEFLNRFECYFLNTLSDAATLVKAVNRPNFGAMFDTFHANIEEKDPAAAIRANPDIIKHVHISENDRGTPGSGHIPFKEIFAALKNGGYDGWYTIEAFDLALPALAAAARVWRKFFISPEEVYTDGYNLIRSLTK